MRIAYPDGIDRMGLTQTKAEHNASTDERSLRLSDIAQVIRAIETKLGTTDSTDTTSHEYRLTAIESAAPAEATVDLTGIEDRLTVLEAAAGSTVSGTGTTNRLALWSASNTLAAGPVTVSGNDITLLGAITAPGAATFQSTVEVYGSFYPKGTLKLFNKAGNGWLDWATRYTGWDEAVYKLSNIGEVGLKHTSAGSTGNYLDVTFNLKNSAGTGLNFAYIRAQSTTITAGAEGGILNFAVLNNAGVHHTPLQVSAYGVIINKRTYNYEGGIDVINKAGNGWLAFVARNTSGTEAVLNLGAIGTITPTTNTNQLTVAGSILATGYVHVSRNGSTFALLQNTATGQGSRTNVIFQMKDSGGGYDDVAVIAGENTVYTAGNETGSLIFSILNNGTAAAQALKMYGTQYALFTGDVKLASGKKFYINDLPHTVVESATTRAPAAGVYDGGLGVNTNSSRNRFLLRGNGTWREVVTGHWECKRTESVSSATGVTLTLANAMPATGERVIPLAFWEDSEGNLNWCRITRTLDGGETDILAFTAYPAEDGATVHMFMLEPDATQ